MDRRAFIASALALPLAGCFRAQNEISVGSKNFTEQLILGEILAQTLEHRTHAPVERRFYLAGSYICHQALLAGRVDMYVEYTGTALAAILKEQPGSDHALVLQRVREQYRKQFGFEVMPPLGFNNTFAIVMRADNARRLGVKNLTALAQFSPQLRLGVGYEFLERKDGFPGLSQTYGLHFAEPARVMDLNLLYRAIENKQVDVIAGSNTDGLIPALDLVVLDDDKHYFPPYDAVPIVRGAAFDRHPEIRNALNSLAGKISEQDMRKMNYEVDKQKRDAAAVAAEFLSHQQM